MGGAASSNHAAVYARGGQDERQTATAQRRPNEELSIAGRAHGRAFTRVLCNVLDTEQPKGHRQGGPSQSRPRARRREPGYKPLGDASTERRHSAPGRQRWQPESGGHPQYGEATHVSAGKSFFWNCSGAAARGSPSGAERLRFEQDSVSFGDSRTDTTSTSSEYREAHKGVAGVCKRDVGDARICSRGEQCPTSSA